MFLSGRQVSILKPEWKGPWINEIFLQVLSLHNKRSKELLSSFLFEFIHSFSVRVTDFQSNIISINFISKDISFL